MEKKQENDDYSFMQEQIKKRPINKKKLLKKTFTTGAMAIMFGIVASLAFILLEPVFTKLVSPKEEKPAISLQEINLPEEQNEVLPENMIQDEHELEEKDKPQADPEPMISSVQKAELEIEDYQKMYGKLAGLAEEVGQSMVVVNGFSSDVDWFSNVYEKKSSVSGLLIADNGTDVYIISNYSYLSSATDIDVEFATGECLSGSIVSYDKATNIAVIAVPMGTISYPTRQSLTYANLGNSNSGNKAGDVVVALGDPMGYSSSVGYGIITSVGTPVNAVDRNYKLITTDIYGSRNAEGYLINTKGQIIGIINQKYNNSDLGNQISAIGISECKGLIEDLSNQTPRPYLGVTMAEITDQAKENGIPQGVFVRKVEMNSPAMEVGIAPGDIITQIGDTPVFSLDEAQMALKILEPEKEADIVVMRATKDAYKAVPVTVTLGTKTE